MVGLNWGKEVLTSGKTEKAEPAIWECVQCSKTPYPNPSKVISSCILDEDSRAVLTLLGTFRA